MNVTWENTENTSTTHTQLATLLANLAGAGMQQLLLPAELLTNQQWTHELIRLLARHALSPTPTRCVRRSRPGNAMVYIAYCHGLSHTIVRLITFIARCARRCAYGKSSQCLLISIIPRLLFLESEAGYFMEKIDGTSKTIKNLQSLLTQWQNLHCFKRGNTWKLVMRAKQRNIACRLW